MLVAILPPLLYSSAFFTSLRDLRRNVRPLSLLAVGLVFVTMLAVAAVCHAAISGLSWPVCFVLGALVAPTDAVAANAIASRLGVPRRLATLIEGESLINDATALVAYEFAVAAVVTGSFSFWHATWHFVVDVVGGIAIGLAVGFVLRQVRRRMNHSPTEIAIALLSGYFAYLPAQAAGVSAVLAAVTVSVYVGWYTPELTNPQTRLQGDAVWNILTFLLNALLFGLVGLQLRPILDSLSGRSTVDVDRRRRDRERGGDRNASDLDLSRHLSAALSLAQDPRTRSVPALAVPDHDRLDRAARRRHAGGRAGAATHDGLERAVSAA